MKAFRAHSKTGAPFPAVPVPRYRPSIHCAIELRDIPSQNPFHERKQENSRGYLYRSDFGHDHCLRYRDGHVNFLKQRTESCLPPAIRSSFLSACLTSLFAFRFAGVPIIHSHGFTASSPLEWKPIRVRKTVRFLSYHFGHRIEIL
jgi:hypothetical protein